MYISTHGVTLYLCMLEHIVSRSPLFNSKVTRIAYLNCTTFGTRTSLLRLGIAILKTKPVTIGIVAMGAALDGVLPRKHTMETLHFLTVVGYSVQCDALVAVDSQ
mmetsp:Transcript_6856/g.14869  ORF Transcript_6856/g.14869 Transcript_6856/m.14869 type:complete len:105 (-) Transcript_6856:1222-1536(-)